MGICYKTIKQMTV